MLSLPGTIVTEVTLNHEFLMSSLYTDSERALARTAIQIHSGEDLRVLVGGLGLGYTAREALLSDRVARVEVVELLPQVIDWLARGLVPLASELRDDMGDGEMGDDEMGGQQTLRGIERDTLLAQTLVRRMIDVDQDHIE